jgi:pseudouridylate synthase
VVQWTVPDSTIVELSREVDEAIAGRRPVVALESSVIAQGLPRPVNFEAALQVEAVVREAGATPATVAAVDGKIRAGLTRDEIERLAFTDGIEKAGARDLGRAVATGATMATTVGASLVIGWAAGIRVLATGGIGGVHRGVEESGDVSHDLQALSTTPMVTVSAGFKSILDLPRTLELLETLGVAIVGYQTDSLPDFYGLDSGFGVPRISDAGQVARMLAAQRELGLRSGIVVVNPPPAELAFGREELTDLVTAAVSSARGAGIHGKESTPYLLAQVAERSGRRSVALNVALLVSNATVAAEIARAVA